MNLVLVLDAEAWSLSAAGSDLITRVPSITAIFIFFHSCMYT